MLPLDDAIAFTLQELRKRLETDRRRGDYGYDIYMLNVARHWAMTQANDQRQWEPIADEVTPTFLDAAWELSRRGILRPGVYTRLGQGTGEGVGYSITEAGERWLREADETHFVLIQPGALAANFERFREKFGDGYYQRTQEAIRCRNAQAWLAACAMAGAAAESVLLAIAIAKISDEESIIKVYKSSNGRKRVTDMVVGQAPKHLARPFQSGMGLLLYWRDNAGHGQTVPISSPEAE